MDWPDNIKYLSGGGRLSAHDKTLYFTSDDSAKIEAVISIALNEAINGILCRKCYRLRKRVPEILFTFGSYKLK